MSAHDWPLAKRATCMKPSRVRFRSDRKKNRDTDSDCEARPRNLIIATYSHQKYGFRNPYSQPSRVSYHVLLVSKDGFSDHGLPNSRYLISSHLPDFTLRFGEKTWNIHKAIACSHSQWFRGAVTGGFQVSKQVDRSSGRSASRKVFQRSD